MQSFYSHGKLLISGEYMVLLGAKALAVPLKKGQQMNIQQSEKVNIQWKSIYHGEIWFEAAFKPKTLKILESTDNTRALYIQQLLKKIQTEKDIFNQNLEFEHILEFHPAWGLGSSSTLINNLAKWAEIDPYKLLNQVSKALATILRAQMQKTPFFFN